ncbi:MAG TPA: 2-dehydropantoate 2-reductase [Syntrophales bacterium]|nr:2-dehydropantoate 2-reductase [Syntrophales bacterium]
MKIAIMGTGGVGGYYGGLLAKAGRDVAFIARGAHLAAMRKSGLQIKSVHGDFKIAKPTATDRPSDIGHTDLIIFATKTYQTDDSAQLIKPMVGKNTVVLPLQNGVDAAERIGEVIGMEHLLGGATWLSAAIESPGVIGQYSDFRRIALGEFSGKTTPRLTAVADLLKETGATVEISDSILKILWTKFVFISSVSAMGSLTRVTFGEYRGVPETRSLLVEAIGEVAAVARARGVKLDADILAKTQAFIDNSAPGIKPSMQRDVEAGKPSELESLIGIVVRMGAEKNVPTPVMRFAYAMLKPGELKGRQC